MYIRFIELEKKVIEFLAIGLLAVAGVSTAIMYNMPKFAAAENAGMLHKVADRGVSIGVHATVNTAIAGVDFNKSLKLAAINEATSAVFEAVGDFAATKGMADGSVGKVALHAGVGAGVAKLMGADPLIGALAAGTAEGLSSHIDNAGDKDSRVKTAGVIGAVTAFAAGGDVRTITSTASLTESARANNRELHPKEQQVLKYALANAKTDEERTRLKLAAQSMVHSSEGVPDADKHKSLLVANDAAGSLYAAEQAKLKATAQGIFGYSDAFEYSSLDSFDDSLSRHDKAFSRTVGGIDVVTGTGMFAKGGVLGKAAGTVLATTGTAKLIGEYNSDIGERVLRSLEEPTGEYYVFRKADELAKDTAIALAAGKAVEKAVEDAAPAIKKIRAGAGVEEVAKPSTEVANAGAGVSGEKATIESTVAPITESASTIKPTPFPTSYWTHSVEFKGSKVYQRNDLIDPHKIHPKYGISNLEAMKKGYAPAGPDNKPINLHHTIQTEQGAIAEVTETFHKQNSKIIHINPTTTESGINRSQFDSWREKYWQNRAKDFK